MVELRSQEKQARLRDWELKQERFRHLTGLTETPAAAVNGPAPGASAAATAAAERPAPSETPA